MDFDQCLSILQMVQGRDPVTVEGWYEVICDVSNGTLSNTVLYSTLLIMHA